MLWNSWSFVRIIEPQNMNRNLEKNHTWRSKVYKKKHKIIRLKLNKMKEKNRKNDFFFFF